MPEITEDTGGYWDKQLKRARRSATPAERVLRKKRDQRSVYGEEEGVRLLPTLANAVRHFEIALVDLENVIPMARPVLVWGHAFECSGELLLGRRKCVRHGSNSRMADTMELVFQATSLSAASETTDETCSFAHGRIATIGLL